MARYKPIAKKRRLINASKESRAIPAWIIAKTQGKVRTNKNRRHWRRNKLKP